MTTDAGRSLLSFVAGLAEPLEKLQNVTGALDTLRDMTGWDLADTGLDPAPFIALSGDVAATLAKFRKLDPDKPITFESIVTLLPEVMKVLSRLAEIGKHTQPASGLPQDVGTQFAEDLFGCLVVLSLGNFHPALRSGLELLGVLAYPERPAIIRSSGRTVRHARAYPKLDFDAIAEFFASPGDALRARFGIADPTGMPAVQVAQRTFPYWAALFRDLGVTAWASGLRAVPNSVPEVEAEAEQRSLFVLLPFDTGPKADASASAVLCFTLFDLPGGSYELVLIPHGALGISRDFGDWRASLTATGQPGGLAIRRSGVDFKGNAAGLAVTAEVARRSSSSPLLRLGATTGIHVELGDLAINGALKVTATAPYVTGGIRLAVKRLRLLVNAAPSDGFLTANLPAQGVGGECDLALYWSGEGGLKFEGRAGLEFSFNLGKAIGPIRIQELTLGLVASERGLEILGAVGIQLALGPLTATVQGVGLRFLLGPASDGTVGLHVDLGFKPPKGVGLTIKAQIVTGGGYLYFDFEKEQYAGVLQLEIAQKFSLSAVGLLTTKMPDGSKGFSLLVIISVRFDPGIQLGYGFSLNGLGGLLGVNRTAMAEGLREGLRRGTLGSVLFPQHIVENAPQIISNLSAIFPPAQDRFLFGPMAIIGWGGSPPILTMELGIILELPEPVRLMILGRLRVTLPAQKDDPTQLEDSGAGDQAKKQDTPKIKLQLDSLGIFNFGTGDISLDAYLYDSTIGPFTLTGGMALRASFGAHPLFLLSVGGFHPAFQAPAGFPSIERVALGLHKQESGVEVRLQLAAYFALTSNTVQFGAHLDLYVHVWEFEIIGLLGFDALIQFQPFGLIASFEAMVSVKAFGQTLMAVRLQVNATGPSPWHVWGKAQFTLLFFSGTAEFDALIGHEDTPALPPPIDVEQELFAELQKHSNWSSQLPEGEHPLVTFRDSALPKDQSGTSPKKKVFIHPLAELHVNQRLVPLNTDPITRYGTTTPTGATTFALEAKVDGEAVTASLLSATPLSDWFARAQFYVMSDAEKLAAPSFEEKNSGVRVKAAEGYTCGTPVGSVMKPAQTSKNGIQSNLEAAKFLDRVAHLGAAGQAPIRAASSTKYGDPAWWDQGITLRKAGYRVVGEEDDGATRKVQTTRRSGTSSPSSLFTEVMDDMAAVAEPVMSYSAAQARATQATSRAPKRRAWVVPDIGRKRGWR